MRRLIRIAGAAVLGVTLLLGVSPLAEADPGGFFKRRNNEFSAGTSSRERTQAPSPRHPGAGANSSGTTAGTGSTTSEGTASGPCPPAGCFAVFTPEAAAGGPAAPPPPDPEVVAREAVARLRLTAPKPSVGPSPALNEWHMAAVGYPLWLWVDGDTDPAPVADADGPLSVTLDARATSVTFDMGDGHRVTCATGGTPWTRDVPAGQPSPDCGYTYQKPSLPKGSYTITATTTWAVDWTINGDRGTIPFAQGASVPVPVGELQVLVR